MLDNILKEILTPLNMKFFYQLLLALALGSLIGIERNLARKSAGMRTFAFVSMGSALFSIISIYAVKYIPMVEGVLFNPVQIASQVVVGVGFIGAGLVFFSGSKLRGVTTAAGLWLSAAVGMAVGFEFYALAVFATILTLLILVLFWFLEEKIIGHLSHLSLNENGGNMADEEEISEEIKIE